MQPQFSIPKKLQELQNKLLKLRRNNKISLRNGDLGKGSAPSNIALIKYWGKSKNTFQHPHNSSVSFTLNHFTSTTEITVLGSFFPEGHAPTFVPKHKFHLADSESLNVSHALPAKTELFLQHILSPFALDIGLDIKSINNFPTACGLASSASGMAALCFALDNLFDLKKHFTPIQREYWLTQWARIGSGSALRSVCLNPKSKFVSWEIISNQSSCMRNITYNAKWNDLMHCVFVIDSKEKTITSSKGHLVADTSPLQKIRQAYVNENFDRFITAIKNFDFEFVAQFTEQDALNMHAVMQTSTPPAKYLNIQTSKIISELISFRNKEDFKAFWTLDAGPNVHILYLKKHREKLLKLHKIVSQILKQDIKIYE